jgi:uncharacterized membrane protein (UPF0127 family)
MNIPPVIRRRIALTAIMAAFLGALFLQSRTMSTVDPKSGALPTHALAYGHIWPLDIANTDALRSLGLGERERYPDGRGMLFLFDFPYPYGFWMKGMRFPLDMVFLSQGRIVFIERGISPEDKRIVAPPVPVDQVIEFNAGGAEDLSVGDRIWYWRGFSR